MNMNKFNIKDLDLFYGDNQALKSINLPVPVQGVSCNCV
jgi:phosphate transport system ATP-binding protein